MRGFTQNRQLGAALPLAVMNRIGRQNGGSVRVLPAFPVALRHAVNRRNPRGPPFPGPVRPACWRPPWVARLRFFIETVTPPRHGRTMRALTRDMRQIVTRRSA